jgi:hypothetical protein
MLPLKHLVLSYFKSDWEYSDYPVRVRNLGDQPSLGKNSGVDFPVKLMPLLRWYAAIVGWEQMSAFGNSAEEALANLECKFNTYKIGPAPLPRPGRRADTEPENQQELDDYEIIAVDFFGNILETNFYSCVLSEASSLHDFLPGDDYSERITSRYGIEISDIRNGNLVKIFRRIYERYEAE